MSSGLRFVLQQAQPGNRTQPYRFPSFAADDSVDVPTNPVLISMLVSESKVRPSKGTLELDRHGKYESPVSPWSLSSSLKKKYNQ